ncbi:MAG: surface lipoprotein assembly modifier [Gammaproteobacteria bacterium]|nr:surface lipoprotein assembly modifier [Gammaproteobacteria bacterium]
MRTPQTGGVRIDRRRLARVFLLNRQLTLFGFSPQLIASRERQTSNSELHNYRRSRVDLLFVRRFQLYRVWFVF